MTFTLISIPVLTAEQAEARISNKPSTRNLSDFSMVNVCSLRGLLTVQHDCRAANIFQLLQIFLLLENISFTGGVHTRTAGPQLTDHSWALVRHRPSAARDTELRAAAAARPDRGAVVCSLAGNTPYNTDIIIFLTLGLTQPPHHTSHSTLHCSIT